MVRFETEGLVFELPEGWLGRMENGTPVIEGPAVNERPTRVVISVDRSTQYTSAEDLGRAQLSALEFQLSGFTLLQEEPLVRKDKLKAWHAVYRWVVSAGEYLYQHMYILLAAGNAYTLTVSFEKKAHLLYASKLREIFASVVVQKGKK